MEIARLGLEVTGRGIRENTDDLKELDGQAGKTEKSAVRLSRALSRVFTAVVIGVGVKAFIGQITAAYQRVENLNRLSRQFDHTLRNVGNTAQTSSVELLRWAEDLEWRTGQAAANVMDISSNLASFGFNREVFYRSIELANDMSAAWGGDLRQNMEGLARALDDPIAGFAMLRQRGISLTDQQAEMVQQLMQTNDKLGAQAIVFEALEEQIKGVAEQGFGGLTAAWQRAQMTWTRAWDSLVRGQGASSDLSESLVELARIVSSPGLINAAMAFGNAVIQIISGITQIAIGAHKAFQDLMNFLNREGGPVERWSNATGPLSDRPTAVLEEQLARRLARLDSDPQGWFGAPDPQARASLLRDIEAFQTELASRLDPEKFNIAGYFDRITAETFDSVEDMWRRLSPGTLAGWEGFNPYEGMDFGVTGKLNAYQEAIKAVNDNIKSLEQQAAAFGLSESAAVRFNTAMDLLRAAEEAKIPITGALIDEINRYADATAIASDRVQELARQQQMIDQINSTLSNGFTDLFMGIVDGSKSAVDSISQLLSQLGRLLINNAFQTLFSGPTIGGGFGGGGGLLGGMLIPGILHSGGVAGVDGYGHGRMFPSSVWDDAERYHNGGIAGLRPNEVPAILERGERVIPANTNIGSANRNEPVVLDIRVSVDETGNIVPLVRQVAGEQADIRVEAYAQGAGERHFAYDRQIKAHPRMAPKG